VCKIVMGPSRSSASSGIGSPGYGIDGPTGPMPGRW
jgi:hypothetical protein